MAVFSSNKQNFDISNLKDGLVVFLTAAPDSDFATTQMEYLKNTDLSNLPISIYFLTDSETENPDFVIDENREIANLSEKIKDQKKLQENILVLTKKDGELKYGDTKESPDNQFNWIEALVSVAKNFGESEADSEGFYKWGQLVPETGEYLCKDCGFVLELEAGVIFPICEVCISGEPDGPSGPSEGYWEKI
jgi:hypothetical protein